MPTRKRTAAPPSQRAANQAFLQEQKRKALELLDASRARNTNRAYKPKQDEFSV
jgi:hypothetical protein